MHVVLITPVVASCSRPQRKWSFTLWNQVIQISLNQLKRRNLYQKKKSCRRFVEYLIDFLSHEYCNIDYGVSYIPDCMLCSFFAHVLLMRWCMCSQLLKWSLLTLLFSINVRWYLWYYCRICFEINRTLKSLKKMHNNDKFCRKESWRIRSS